MNLSTIRMQQERFKIKSQKTSLIFDQITINCDYQRILESLSTWLCINSNDSNASVLRLNCEIFQSFTKNSYKGEPQFLGFMQTL